MQRLRESNQRHDDDAPFRRHSQERPCRRLLRLDDRLQHPRGHAGGADQPVAARAQGRGRSAQVRDRSGRGERHDATRRFPHRRRGRAGQHAPWRGRPDVGHGPPARSLGPDSHGRLFPGRRLLPDSGHAAGTRPWRAHRGRLDARRSHALHDQERRQLHARNRRGGSRRLVRFRPRGIAGRARRDLRTCAPVDPRRPP